MWKWFTFPMDLPKKCKQTKLHATHQNCASCGDTICKQCACGMDVAAIQGDTWVVSEKVGNYTIYFCEQDCAAENADSTKTNKEHPMNMQMQGMGTPSTPK